MRNITESGRKVQDNQRSESRDDQSEPGFLKRITLGREAQAGSAGFPLPLATWLFGYGLKVPSICLGALWTFGGSGVHLPARSFDAGFWGKGAGGALSKLGRETECYQNCATEPFH